jgi:hypothetical protein
MGFLREYSMFLVFSAIKICKNCKRKTKNQLMSIFTNLNKPPGQKFLDRERGHVPEREGVCTKLN